MTTSTVSATEPAVAAPVVPAAAAAPVFDAVVSQRQIDELKEQVAEGTRATQYWADKAARGAPAPAAAVEEDEPDVLEAITTGGAKGFDALASKRGFIRRSEVESLIDQRANSLTKEQELIGRFPDLKNKNSEFFKGVALNYGDLIKSGMPQSLAMEAAANNTELAWIKNGKLKSGHEPAPTAAEKETARLARVAAQAGDGNGRRPAPVEDEDDTSIDEKTRRMIAGMGISEEAYLKRAKAGVQMGGRR